MKSKIPQEDSHEAASPTDPSTANPLLDCVYAAVGRRLASGGLRRDIQYNVVLPLTAAQMERILEIVERGLLETQSDL